MSENNIISQIFGNSTTLPGSLVVDKLISSGIAICSEFAEPIIQSWIDSGLVKSEDKNLVLVPQGPSSDEIKKMWFKLRQLEKTGPEPYVMKIQAESFERWCGWAYFILDNELREKAQGLGYTPKPEQRGEFNKILQK